MTSARRSSRLLSLLSTLVLTLACGKSSAPSDTDAGALDALRNQPIVAGESLGEVRLQEMTLETFAAAYGSGFATMVMSDEIGIELSFRERQLAFLFVGEGPCDARLRSAGRQVGPLMGDKLRGFQEKFPECRTMPLHSIGVRAGSSKERTWYQGKVAEIVGLWDPAAQAGQVPGTPDGPAQLVAGMRNDSDLESLRLRGIWLEYDKHPEGSLVRYIAIFRTTGSP